MVSSRYDDDVLSLSFSLSFSPPLAFDDRKLWDPFDVLLLFFKLGCKCGTPPPLVRRHRKGEAKAYTQKRESRVSRGQITVGDGSRNGGGVASLRRSWVNKIGGTRLFAFKGKTHPRRTTCWGPTTHLLYLHLHGTCTSSAHQHHQQCLCRS